MVAGREEEELEEALVVCGAAGGGAYLACRLMASTLTGTASGLLSTTSTRPSSPQTCRGAKGKIYHTVAYAWLRESGMC